MTSTPYASAGSDRTVDRSEVDRFVRALRLVLNEAQELSVSGETGTRLSNRIALALALTAQLCRVLELDERDAVVGYGAAITSALFPLGTSFYEVDGVPVSVDPGGANARAWDIPGSRHFPLPFDHDAEPLSEKDFLYRVDAMLNP
jgi:hypothetical protein